MEYIFSFFKSIADKSPCELSILDLLKSIKTGTYKENIEKLRKEANTSKRNQIKRSLPAVTISGVFMGGRKAKNQKCHSGLLQIDIDKVKDLPKTIDFLKNDKFTFACFVSPSGNGIKVLVKIRPKTSLHLQQFREIEQYYWNAYAIKVDQQCKDVTRLMFVSFDEDLFHNPNSTQWETNYETLFQEALNQISIFETFIEGNRNDFVYKLACKCREKDVPLDFSLTAIISKYQNESFLQNEIATTVKSAYKRETINCDSSRENQERKEVGQSLFARVESYLTDKYEIRFNVVSTKVEYRLRNSNEGFIELNENTILRELYHNNLEIPMSKLSALLGSDYALAYNPFLDYFENLGKWDSNSEDDYIEKLATYIPVNDKDRFKVQLKKMLVRSIACALDDKVFNKQVFVLVHDKQNSGKSTFCRWLCPSKLFNYIAENINTDKDSLIALSTNFYINMDELATLSKSEINSLKSFISKDKINVRLPFGRRTSMFPRRASFIGSTNKDEFLTDETGSIRWLCFELTDKIDFNYKTELNIDDIYRQAYSLYRYGFDYQLTPKEIEQNELANRKHIETTIEIDLIPKFYNPSSKETGGKFITPADMIKKMNETYPTAKINCTSIGKALKILGFQKKQLYQPEKGFSIKGYFVEEINH